MKRRILIGLVIGLFGISLVGCSTGKTSPRKPKYVFLMIGDGMGVAHREVAERYVLLKNAPAGEGLAMNHLPVSGLTTTSEITGKTTDSAAGGTALACGQKTVSKAVGMAADLQTPLRSVAYDAQANGKKVGIVTSVPIDHATPASFYASVTNRYMYYEIDEFIPRSNFDYFAGEPMLGRSKAKGKTPPEQLVRDAGYQLVNNRIGFDAIKPGMGKVLIEHSTGYAIDGPQEISLADFTRKGIELLDGEGGFFMMVEGGKIDWSAHANDLATMIHEMLAFDEAVQVAIDFCRKHPEDTLLIVTADHETGGLQLLPDEANSRMVAAIDAQQFQGAHYVEQVNQWKQGGSVTTDVAFERLTDSFGLTNLSEASEAHLRTTMSSALSDETKDTRDPAIQKMYGNRNAAVVSCLHELSARAGTQWSTFGHTNDPVKTTALGPWANRFGGENDNTDIGRILRDLLTM